MQLQYTNYIQVEGSEVARGQQLMQGLLNQPLPPRILNPNPYTHLQPLVTHSYLINLEISLLIAIGFHIKWCTYRIFRILFPSLQKVLLNRAALVALGWRNNI